MVDGPAGLDHFKETSGTLGSKATRTRLSSAPGRPGAVRHGLPAGPRSKLGPSAERVVALAPGHAVGGVDGGRNAANGLVTTRVRVTKWESVAGLPPSGVGRAGL